ncbi:MAG: hypothetical protein MR411_02260 [Tenericutes bacterium]|nr:hypothetical protein [Mycoplasmatota bacterium]MDY3801683.1 hypothetical protein [Bacilli bacterium]
MNWRETAQQVVFNASLAGRDDESKNEVKETSVIGINANKVDSMNSAIKDYVDNLEKHLEYLKEYVKTNNDLFLKYDEQINNYILDITNTCNVVTNKLNDLKVQLDDVKHEYENQNKPTSDQLLSNVSIFENVEKY